MLNTKHNKLRDLILIYLKQGRNITFDASHIFFKYITS